MKQIVLVLMILVIAYTGNAQVTRPVSKKEAKREAKAARREHINELIRQQEEGEIIFNKQNVFGIKLATDGYGLSYEVGKFKSNRLSTLYQFEISEKKHPKEKKQSGYSGSPYQINSLVPGKLNNFYQVKLGVAQQRIIGGKGNKNGVAVSAVYGGGLSLGLLKPYYVDVEGTRVTYDKVVDSAYFPKGASGFTVGWGEVKFRPGIVGKAAMRFDYGRLNETVTAIEVGLDAEYFVQKIPQMLFNKEKKFFFSAYVTLLLGKRK